MFADVSHALMLKAKALSKGDIEIPTFQCIYILRQTEESTESPHLTLSIDSWNCSKTSQKETSFTVG